MPYTTRSSEIETVGVSRPEVLTEEVIADYRAAGEAHRELRKYARRIAAPGKNLYDFCGDCEERVRLLTGHDPRAPLKAGIAFPCGVSLNADAAHYTPNPGDDRAIAHGDILKFDIGTHVNGHLVDSAFTLNWNPELEPLVQASKEATTRAIRLAAPDLSIGDLGDLIEEIICSYEVELDGKAVPIQPIRNLSGHQVAHYRIHAGNSIPNAAGTGLSNGRMKEGEVYALETFASTGRGNVHDGTDTSHYMLHPSLATGDVLPPGVRGRAAAKLVPMLRRNYSAMAFCPRMIMHDDARFEDGSWRVALRELADKGIVNCYPTLTDSTGCYTSQHEHTFALYGDKKEVFSMVDGDSY
eukprot:gnl/Ergobibamus_cyprinoides/559.p1 GENE.gnl/Ergobibamus_cyprinoides/559~~gnl/Ergobibamus_cyprinoides/559.p1  ORF type:complete len:409 (-),score=150.30 gnl/Ergobibamus_cyprinoides/559:28-1092(-)